jgi:pimeloyl-ACP methyl ester carboxylesterase
VKSRVTSVRALLGRGELKIIEGADHMTTLINPAFGATVIEFLRSGKLKEAGGRG